MSQMEVLKGSMGIICLVNYTWESDEALNYIETNGTKSYFLNREITYFIYFVSLDDVRNHTGYDALESTLLRKN